MSRSYLFRSLISHQWKQGTRSAYYEKGILMKIFIGIMILYMAINLVVLGLFIGKILEGAFPDDDLVRAFSLILFYYFLADILLRFFLQPLPVLGIVPYLHLPVKRSALFNFLLLKSGLSLFNYFPLLILIPFTMRSAVPAWGGLYSFNWFATVLLLIFSNNYMAFLLKKIYPGRPWIMPLLLLAAIALVVLDYKSHQAVSGAFANVLTAIAAHSYLLILPLTLLLILYPASWILLYKNRYLELAAKKEKLLFSGSQGGFFDSFGIAGRLAMMELKLILRNNRPRSFLMLSGMFLFYGFLIYPPQSRSAGEGMFLFVGLLITGIFMMQYGQLIMGWESRSFDKIVTSPLRMQDYFWGKFWFFFTANGILFLLTLPYAFYGYHIVLINLACFLYHSGINSFIILFLGTYNNKRIDLGKGAMFNYEGTSFIHFLLILPLIGLPYLIWLPFSLLGHPALGIAAVGLAGAAGLLFSQVLILITVKQFNSRKYKILNGFRTT